MQCVWLLIFTNVMKKEFLSKYTNLETSPEPGCRKDLKINV